MMTEHECQWRKVNVWVTEPAAKDWHIDTQIRQSICTICERQRSENYTGVRKRYRSTFQNRTNIPQWLVTIPLARGRGLDELITILGKNRLEIEDLVGDWLDAGYVVVEEHQSKSNSVYIMNRIWLTETAQQHLIVKPQAEKSAEDMKAKQKLLNLLNSWQNDYTVALQIHHLDSELCQVIEKIAGWLKDQVSALEADRWVALPLSSQRSGSTAHQRWLAVLRGTLKLLANNHWEYERTFSSRWLGDSKAFSADRRNIEKYLQIEGGFERLGLVRHTPVIRCWGAWQTRFGDYVIHGQAGTPFITLSALTIQNLQDIRIDAEQILIIENQTVFETLLREPNLQTLYLFGSGFSGYAEREILLQWLKAKPSLTWSVWTDYDVGGVRIQRFWKDWAIQHNLPQPKSYLWILENLQKWVSLGKPLTTTEHNALVQIDDNLAHILLTVGYKIEQEALLTQSFIKAL
jgi:hypothetical protein